jgi:hypothetical protein
MAGKNQNTLKIQLFCSRSLATLPPLSALRREMLLLLGQADGH